MPPPSRTPSAAADSSFAGRAEDEADGDAIFDVLQQWTTGVFSQDNVASAFTGLSVPPSSQRRLQQAAASLNEVRAGDRSLNEFMCLLPPSSQTRVEHLSIHAGMPPSNQQAAAPTTSALSLAVLAASAACAPRVQLQVEDDSSSSEAELSAHVDPSASSTALQTPSASSAPLQTSGYGGPLPPAEVQRLLQLPIGQLSENARRALSGSHVGYLQFFHFAGLVRPEEIVRHGKQSREEPVALRERWQCRSCHKFLHCKPNRPANIGTHLLGSSDTPSCLNERRNNPAEPIPTPQRDASGQLVRMHAAKRKRSETTRQRKGGKTSPTARSAHSFSATSQTSLRTGVSDATVAAPAVAPLQPLVLINPQPFFYVGTTLSCRILTSTWPASLLTGWIPTDVRGHSLDYFIHPDDRVAFLLLMQSRDTDPASLRVALDSAHHRVAGATEPVLSTTWVSTCDIPGSTRTAQCRIRHDYGFFDYYAIRAHFCEAASRNGTFTVTWTCLKIGNDRDFPPLLQSASSPLPQA